MDALRLPCTDPALPTRQPGGWGCGCRGPWQDVLRRKGWGGRVWARLGNGREGSGAAVGQSEARGSDTRFRVGVDVGLGHRERFISHRLGEFTQTLT